MRTISLLLLFILPTIVIADVVVPAEKVENSVNIRLEPDSNSDVVGKLRKGESLPHVSSESGWHVVQLEGDATGYISADWSVVQSDEPEVVEEAVAEAVVEAVVEDVSEDVVAETAEESVEDTLEEAVDEAATEAVAEIEETVEEEAVAEIEEAIEEEVVAVDEAEPVEAVEPVAEAEPAAEPVAETVVVAGPQGPP